VVTDLFDRRSQRSVPIALFVIAAALLVARFTYAPPAKDPSRKLVRWVSAQEAASLAHSEGKPILYDFTADWCRPCHLLDAEVFGDERMATDIGERFVCVRVTDRKQEEGKNAMYVDELQGRYAVRGFPTIVFTNAAGTELARMEGYRGRAELQRIMERVR
jgi:thiol:disulfide interchange protein